VGEAAPDLGGDDLAEGQAGGADVEPDDLELSGDALGRLGDALVPELVTQRGVLRHSTDDRHQVGFAGAVRGDDEDALFLRGT